MATSNQRFLSLLDRMAAAICAGDADGAAACFVPEGVYHDGFYGEFKGRREIARMVRELFHRDARDFTWTFSGAVSGAMGKSSNARPCSQSWASQTNGSSNR
jgi:hypothetical protein